MVISGGAYVYVSGERAGRFLVDGLATTVQVRGSLAGMGKATSLLASQ
jgi:hypothetical protein